MKERELTVENRAGIHARPATEIVKTASRFKSDIFFVKDSMRINGKSVMGIITLGATYKTRLLCQCDGEDEEELLEAMTQLFANRFTP
ncbi:MAG: HPr family phosphocarrier protein [Spirochaetes bacterium]|uniref:HPr family phosphocarrier protein n=1 Tax=Candidatus Aphodenecus pullistercoris TaxID=2840669 RepID=A0A9D9EAR1_9SPIR|nr:HPr family phosphocarrier protein [Candidatus Aphodenecus pullistercoris]